MSRAQVQQPQAPLSPQFFRQPARAYSPISTQPFVYSSPKVQPVLQVVQPVLAHPPRIPVSPKVLGGSRVEYFPYEKTVLEYEEVQVPMQVQKEKKVKDYYAVEYVTDYIPQVKQVPYTEYVTVDSYQQVVTYQPVETSFIRQPAPQQYVQQVAQPVFQQPQFSASTLRLQKPSYAPQQYIPQQYVPQQRPPQTRGPLPYGLPPGVPQQLQPHRTSQPPSNQNPPSQQPQSQPQSHPQSRSSQPKSQKQFDDIPPVEQ